MIAQIPAEVFEVPQYALWNIAGWVFSLLLSGWWCYRWGLRSQRENAKREARIKALAMLDRVSAAVHPANWLPKILTNTRPELEQLVFDFAARVGAAARNRIHAAWKPYGALSEHQVHPDSSRTNMTAEGVVDLSKMRATMLEPLKKLRYEIERA